jgi:hypothetical protein
MIPPPIGQRWAATFLVTCGLALAAESRPGDVERRRSFVPAGWEIGDCPPAYGPHAVLCAGTDTGQFKVDRHVPTVWIDAPGTSCAESEKALLAHWDGKMSVARRLSGRCGPSDAPCTEIHFKDPRPVDPVGAIAYVVCPATGPVELVQYGVSAKVIGRFEPVARAQARWRVGR